MLSLTAVGNVGYKINVSSDHKDSISRPTLGTDILPCKHILLRGLNKISLLFVGKLILLRD